MKKFVLIALFTSLAFSVTADNEDMNASEEYKPTLLSSLYDYFEDDDDDDYEHGDCDDDDDYKHDDDDDYEHGDCDDDDHSYSKSKKRTTDQSVVVPSNAQPNNDLFDNTPTK